ncbi:MAG: lycopene beta-cyclase CrtY [Deltaproteobacteria bacterium]|nr:lycopene beta-cyclase CrtY [Deltaproteobacteria bacterium]
MIVDTDYALVGGGLANGLIALAIKARQPEARIAMIERGEAPGGNHTWCFHAADITAETASWIEPLVVTRWTGYDVAFPEHRRQLDSPYACVTSDRLAERVTHALAAPGSQLLTRTTAVEVGTDYVTMQAQDGSLSTLRARAVIEARGPDHAVPDHAVPRACAWQKFLGMEVRLTRPHGLERPMLMDATVPQRDGFRFCYVLPLAPDRLLIEDTYFSDGTRLDVTELRGEILRYAAAHGWTIAEIVREEVGVLALPWQGDPPDGRAPLIAGYAGGWFHPVTGYSFPIAARLAAFVAERPADQLFGPALDELAERHARQLDFALRLNGMLFKWFPPAQRYHVLSRFYRLPEAIIQRFYALELTALDRARILVGRPPRGLSLRAVFGREAT